MLSNDTAKHTILRDFREGIGGDWGNTGTELRDSSFSRDIGPDDNGELDTGSGFDPDFVFLNQLKKYPPLSPEAEAAVLQKLAGAREAIAQETMLLPLALEVALDRCTQRGKKGKDEDSNLIVDLENLLSGTKAAYSEFRDGRRSFDSYSHLLYQNLFTLISINREKDIFSTSDLVSLRKRVLEMYAELEPVFTELKDIEKHLGMKPESLLKEIEKKWNVNVDAILAKCNGHTTPELQDRFSRVVQQLRNWEDNALTPHNLFIPVWEKVENLISHDLPTRNKLIEHNLRLAFSFAKRVASGKRALRYFPDLIQEGCVVLSHAMDLFEPQRGFKFSTFACRLLLQRLAEKADEFTHTITIPRSTLALLGSLDPAIQRLQQNGNAKPSVPDITSELGRTSDTVKRVIHAARQRVFAEADTGGLKVEDFLPGNTVRRRNGESIIQNPDTPAVSNIIDADDLKAVLSSEFYKTLSFNKRVILALRFGVRPQAFNDAEVADLFGLQVSELKDIRQEAKIRIDLERTENIKIIEIKQAQNGDKEQKILTREGLEYFVLFLTGDIPRIQAATLEDVSVVFGVTKERVRQIQEKALSELREHLESGNGHLI